MQNIDKRIELVCFEAFLLVYVFEMPISSLFVRFHTAQYDICHNLSQMILYAKLIDCVFVKASEPNADVGGVSWCERKQCRGSGSMEADDEPQTARRCFPQFSCFKKMQNTFFFCSSDRFSISCKILIKKKIKKIQHVPSDILENPSNG